MRSLIKYAEALIHTKMDLNFWILKVKVANILFICLLMNTCYGNEEYKIVHTISGDIRGIQNRTLYDDKAYWSFKGIPYAQPPIGSLRFQSPQKVTPWSSIKNTFQFGNECVQSPLFGGRSFGDENCLFINVYVPDIKTAEKLSTMVFIHGGGFVSGSGNMYGPDFLINNDVILVTFNYRLGPIGFLSIGANNYSGNMGLKDQNLALKWVHDNIESFGGDSNSITLFGESAGAASTHWHVLSPKSRGLFRRAIIQSACVLNPFAYHYKNNHVMELTEFAKKHGVNAENPDDLLQFLLKVDAKILTKDTSILLYNSAADRKEIDLTWTPVIEDKSATDAFLTDYPINLLQQKDTENLDILFGLMSNEMLMFLTDEIKDPFIMDAFDKKFEMQLPLKHLKYKYESKAYKQISEEIRQFYFNGQHLNDNEKYLAKFSELFSDIWFVYGIDKSAKFQAKRSNGKTYLYINSLDTKLNILKKMVGATDFEGATHADDLFYLFRIYGSLFGEEPIDFYSDLASDSIEVKSIEQLTKLWTNFAKFGTPTLDQDAVNFKSIEINQINYVNITNRGLVSGVNPLARNIQFWDNIYKKYEIVFNNDAVEKDEL